MCTNKNYPLYGILFCLQCNQYFYTLYCLGWTLTSLYVYTCRSLLDCAYCTSSHSFQISLLSSLRVPPLLTPPNQPMWSQPSLTQNPIPSLKSNHLIPRAQTIKGLAEVASWLYCRAPPQSMVSTCTIITVISVRGR